MKTVMTDFNAVDGEGHILALTEYADADPYLDERVFLRDYEGNSAEGIVARKKNTLLYIKIDWDTWDPGTWNES